jgi:hypothetical protein
MSKSSVRLTIASLGPEDELLLCLARTGMDADVTERAQALMRSHIDWDKLHQRGLQHRVAPLLYANLSVLCPESLPPTILEQLRYLFESNAARNLLLTSHLIRILNVLTLQDLSAVPFKGPVLATLAYNGLAWRACGDLDILVHTRDAVRARDVLMAHGYRPKVQGGGPWDASYLRYAYEAQLVHPDDGVCVDLHWRLTGNAFPFHLHPEHIWRHLQPVTLLGTTMHTLRSDDLLLYLCVHGAKHVWCNLGLVCDVAELIRHRPEIVSEQLIARAQVLGSERILSLGLVLAQHLMDVPLPHSLSQQVQGNPRVISLAEQMVQGLFDQDHQQLDQTETLILKFKMRERFQDRRQQGLHWLVHMLRPNKLDRALVTLPAGYACLYYWLRPMRLIRTYGMKSFRQILRIPGVLLKALR